MGTADATKKTEGLTYQIDPARLARMVSEIEAGHELLGELLQSMLKAGATEAPPSVAEGSGVKPAPRLARGTTPPPAPAPSGTGRGKANLNDPRLRGKTELVREYNGWRIVVHVRPDGFEWGGKVWPSLSAIAKAVTGTSRNGFEFFGLEERDRRSS